MKSDQFPEDANEKIQKVNLALMQLTGAGLTTMIGQVDPTAQQALLAAGPAGALGIMPSDQLASVADAALDAALGVTSTASAVAVATSVAAPTAFDTAASGTLAAPTNAAAPNVTPTTPTVDAKIVGRSDNPTQHILVHNMFDKDEETDPGWENDIKLDFEEECAQYGKIASVVVMSKSAGGKIYASFESFDAATKCANNLAGRWFDKRQLRVEFVDSIPDSS